MATVAFDVGVGVIWVSFCRAKAHVKEGFDWKLFWLHFLCISIFAYDAPF